MMINFFNPHSIKLLLERFDFNVLNISTPGKLDIDIMANNSDLINDRFWSNFINIASEEEKIIWQKFISERGMSSHMMAVCQAS